MPSITGFERERKIRDSGIRELFTPHKPIDSLELLYGRENQVSQLVSYLSTPGQHALLYGDRGVGKSSLANVVTKAMEAEGLINGQIFIKRCDENDTFLNIFRKPLEALNYSLELDSWEQSSKDSLNGELKAGIGVLKGGKDKGGTAKFTVTRDNLNPSFVADVLEKSFGLLLIDEADAIADSEKKKLAQLIKLLGDCDSPFKLLVVGTAEVGAKLTAGHQSVQRNLKETRLERMSTEALVNIIEEGSKKANLAFSSFVIDHIASISAGYPYFTHLLSLKCAEEAIGENHPEVNRLILQLALELAVDEAEGSLKREYLKAVRSHQTDGYSNVLLACALCGKHEFTTTEVKNSLQQVLKKKVRDHKLNNYWGRLVSNDSTKILRRLSKGVFRFNDPRMPSYILIADSKKHLAITSSKEPDFDASVKVSQSE